MQHAVSDLSLKHDARSGWVSQSKAVRQSLPSNVVTVHIDQASDIQLVTTLDHHQYVVDDAQIQRLSLVLDSSNEVSGLPLKPQSRG